MGVAVEIRFCILALKETIQQKLKGTFFSFSWRYTLWMLMFSVEKQL